ncbi:MAG TPA: hypothetical protein VI456_09935, partial [Polyangia bacterium]
SPLRVDGRAGGVILVGQLRLCGYERLMSALPPLAIALVLAGRTALAAEPPPPAAPSSPAAVSSSAAPVRPTAAVSATPVGEAPASKRPAIREAAPRPEAAVRVQQRFAVKANQMQLFGGAEYLSRGDFYNSPGLRVGGAYYVLESLGLEVQLSHFWSSLDATAEQVKMTTGTLPDSHAPGWLAVVGARYSIGYGKLMVGGLGGVIHFEPQAFVHGGLHDNDGELGPSADFGLGFLVYLMPRMFLRADVAVTLDWETRSGQTDTVWGTLPALSVGGML